MTFDPPEAKPRSEPILFAPSPLLVLIGLMVALHACRVFVLGLFEDPDLRLLDLAAFVPARFSMFFGLASEDSIHAAILSAPRELQVLQTALFRLFVAEGEPRLWTAVTYAMLHGSWEHLIFNSLWLLAFGSPVMERFGALRFLLFFVVTAAIAAAFHALLNPTDVAALVGASGAVSGLTAAALRFAMGPGMFGAEREAWRRPAPPLSAALRDHRVLIFAGVWFGINLLAGLGAPVGGGDGLRIAWEAHVGGFLAGLFLFSMFDPIRN